MVASQLHWHSPLYVAIYLISRIAVQFSTLRPPSPSCVDNNMSKCHPYIMHKWTGSVQKVWMCATHIWAHMKNDLLWLCNFSTLFSIFFVCLFHETLAGCFMSCKYTYDRPQWFMSADSQHCWSVAPSVQIVCTVQCVRPVNSGVCPPFWSFCFLLFYCNLLFSLPNTFGRQWQRIQPLFSRSQKLSI